VHPPADRVVAAGLRRSTSVGWDRRNAARRQVPARPLRLLPGRRRRSGRPVGARADRRGDAM